MRLRDLQPYIDALDENSEFAVSVRSIETGKGFALSYAVGPGINEYDELVLSIDVELCLGCTFLQKYDWRKNDAARCVIQKPYYGLSFDSMRKRRSALKSVAAILESIRNAQLRALENTPKNFRGTGNYETGNIAIDALDGAIDILKGIF